MSSKSTALTFLFFNLFYLILSLIMISTGIFTRYFLSAIDLNTYESYASATKYFIIIGAIMIIVPFTSCTILIKEYKALIVLYKLAMFIILVAEIYVGFHTHSIAYRTKNFNNKTLTEVFRLVPPTNINNKNNLYDGNSARAISIQLSLHCCGIDGPNYWVKEKRFMVDHWCCEQTESTLSNNSCESSNSTRWTKGCLQQSNELSQKTSHVLSIVIFFIASFKIIGLLFFMCKFKRSEI